MKAQLHGSREPRNPFPKFGELWVYRYSNTQSTVYLLCDHDGSCALVPVAVFGSDDVVGVIDADHIYPTEMQNNSFWSRLNVPLTLEND